MNVLIPYDIDLTGMRNPYLHLLLRELQRHPGITSLRHGYGWLHEEGKYDVIHLHWPEILVAAQVPGPWSESVIRREYIDRLIRTLHGWKQRGARIVLTVHNEQPHLDPSGMCGILYHKVYELVDGFIHMGKSSQKLLRKSFRSKVEGKSSFIIPHGDYRFFREDWYGDGFPAPDRTISRRILGIRKREKLMLTFGAIRTPQELDLAIEAFKRADVPDSVYLMAGKIPYPFKAQKQHFPTRRKLYLSRFTRWKDRLRTDERIIPPNEVQHYLLAADLLFIPRFRALNSGNVPLGFTFGRVVVGPDYGVIGESLAATGNPVYDPYDLSSVSEAIRQGFALADLGHGEKNRHYAEANLGWDRIAQMTVDAYRVVAGQC